MLCCRALQDTDGILYGAVTEVVTVLVFIIDNGKVWVIYSCQLVSELICTFKGCANKKQEVQYIWNKFLKTDVKNTFLSSVQ